MARRADIHLCPAGEPPPRVVVDGRRTRVLAEQTAAVDPARLGKLTGKLTFEELRRVDAALRLVLDV